MNYLEQLAYEWYEYLGYVVIRNRRVGLRDNGGWDGELDVIAYSSSQNKLIHIECSNDALSWNDRKIRYNKKFILGEKHIPTILPNFKGDIEQIILLGRMEKTSKRILNKAKVITLKDFLEDIISGIQSMFLNDPSHKMIIPEQYPLLRTVYYMHKYFNEVSIIA